MSAPVSTHHAVIDSDLLRREVERRRRLLGAMALLFVFSTSPVLGHHLVRAVDWLPASLEHLGPFCMVALHLLLAPLHSAFHWLLFGGFGYALVDRLLAQMRLQRMLQRVHFATPKPGDAAFHAARLAGVKPRHLCVAPDLTVPAFTAGVWSPIIYLSSGLVASLSVEELAAVVAHEEAHRLRRDPLRLSALRFLSRLLFWMPALRRIADDIADEAEIDADTFAADRFPMALASAMVIMARGAASDRALRAAVRFHSPDLLERRMERLAGVERPLGMRVSRGSLTLAGVALVAAWASGLMVLHPLPQPGDVHAPSAHCATHNSSPLLHLFCRGWTLRMHDTPCPHALANRALSGRQS